MALNALALALNTKSLKTSLENSSALMLLVSAKKHDRIRQVLLDRLHWLPVPQRVQFKLCLLMFKALHELAPSYLADLCRPAVSVGSRRSATRGDLVISSTVTIFGARLFTVAGPRGSDYRHGTSCRHIHMPSSRSASSKLL